jgi:hypothetical protein
MSHKICSPISFALTGLRFLVVVELARSTKYHVDSQRTTHTLVDGVVIRQHRRRVCGVASASNLSVSNLQTFGFSTLQLAPAAALLLRMAVTDKSF